MRRVNERERDFDARVGFVNLLIQMSFNDAIVVYAKPFADRILSNLQTAVEVTSEGGCKKESYRERERSRLKSFPQGASRWGLDQCQPYLLADICLIGASGGRQQTTSIHGCILMVDAGGDGQGDSECV